ncbi:hypothetical protein JNK13_03120 [bacterium]|nr:hypothetical protein [bacterium]
MKIKFSLLTLPIVTVALVQSSTTVIADDLAQMISPVSQPVIFEDPRHSTELRPIFVHHELQDDFVTGGGDVQVYALQARFKLTDDLSLIAVKDGIVDLNPSAVVPSDTGIADIAAGLKYSFFKCDTAIATAGLTYEIPLGDEDILQGQGDGMFNPFLSAGAVQGNWNFMGHTGYRIRVDDADSSFFDLNAHVSYKVDNFYPLVELGLNHVTNSGNRLPIADEGQDYFNFGAANSAGENLISMSVGARYRLADNIDVGAAYQFPLEREEGSNVLDWRITADMIIRFSLV